MIKKSNNPWRSWLVIALIALVFFSMYRLNPNRPETRVLTQHEFYAALANNQIAAPITRVLDRDAGETYLTGHLLPAAQPSETPSVASGEGKASAAAGKTAEIAFRVPLVPGENDALMADLFRRGLNVRIETRQSAFSPFVTQLLFFFGFLALFYWFMGRRAGGAGGGIFGMGKSRAKMLTGKEERKRVTFADVAGVDEAKGEVQEVVEFLKKPEKFRKIGARIPKGVLLVGPPGTGKTLLARAIAGEAGVPFFAISGSDFEEMFVGVGASRMRDMFAEAKKRAPCIIFIDEIDSIGMKRTGAGALGGNHAYEQTLNTLLVEMDGFDANEGVIVIAATNRPDTLDAALLRPGRFDRQVIVDLPTLKGREEILRLHGKKIKFAPDVNLNRIARGTPGFSGADLANLLNEAALLAVRKGLAAVNQATLDEARDKVIWGSERKSAGYSRHDREITAWHESGHALLQLLLAHTDPLHKVTIIPRGRALGATMSLPEQDVLNRTRAQFLDEIVVMCGGRIAEEMFTGDISTGAAQDLAMATDTALKMVCSYGMCDKFGFRTFRGTSPFASENLPPAFSDETRRAVDAEVSEIVHKAYAQADELLKANRDKLEKLAETLLDKESMDGRDVAALLGLPFRDDPGEDKADEKKPAEAEKPAEAGAARPAEDAKPADEVADADKEEKPGA